MITSRKASESERFSTFLGWIALLFHGFLSKTCKQGETCKLLMSSSLLFQIEIGMGSSFWKYKGPFTV
jgi:hypothetical protein